MLDRFEDLKRMARNEGISLESIEGDIEANNDRELV